MRLARSPHPTLEQKNQPTQAVCSLVEGTRSMMAFDDSFQMGKRINEQVTSLEDGQARCEQTWPDFSSRS